MNAEYEVSVMSINTDLTLKTKVVASTCWDAIQFVTDSFGWKPIELETHLGLVNTPTGPVEISAYPI
jgi:hypothetical protein